ncbi:potassium-transporting ATPase F chain [Agrobacterium rubi TR3 = NBRC 13261]|uniref:Potassium-transporting ATPase F chain n=1 Tax=Agrobacterium rubi TR3 = NBRC 13261 TaxID=1368415 RepID=A0A081D0R0_9HYPH|nr:K(+)-transporting ATPase subunit F [Agrobacterium rubi]MBP1881133.1 K+-transporting ATPase KdpF subunit [Agrobacterium rubi]GAK72506.1 potassium-transporting ATPase F chain [Agrobacterium rubi TR3 = NBRC 13261]
MHARSTSCEGDMIEALLALAVAGALVVYLVVTLLRPERF